MRHRPPGTATVIRGDALALPLADDTVDLVVTSPPYFGLRSYQDGGEHYSGQIGSEATPAEFVDALIVATREMVRVLKPSGSIWVNLGDKYVADNRGSGGDVKRGEAKWAPAGPAGYPGEGIMARKSLRRHRHHHTPRQSTRPDRDQRRHVQRLLPPSTVAHHRSRRTRTRTPSRQAGQTSRRTSVPIRRRTDHL